MTVQQFRLPDEQRKERLDRVLVGLLTDVSRATVQRWIDEGRVLVDGHAGRAKELVRAGALLEVEPGPQPPSSATPDPTVEFGVVYEDEDLLVVNKPAGLVVHPARGHLDGTLVNGLLARHAVAPEMLDEETSDGLARPGIVHRLDKDTSGLMVVAKTPAAREGLKAQLQVHEVRRIYVALTVGVPRDARIESLHGRHPSSRLKFTSLCRDGKSAITHVRLLERFEGAAYVECQLETGRTHQIRVHLAERCRTPLISDALYGGGKVTPMSEVAAAHIHRQALHARQLGFVHPRTAEALSFEVPLPEDFQAALDALRQPAG